MRYSTEPGFRCGRLTTLNLSEARPLLSVIGTIKRSYFWCHDAYNLDHLASLASGIKDAAASVETAARSHETLADLRVRDRGYDLVTEAMRVPATFNKRRIDREAHKVIALSSGELRLTNATGRVIVRPLELWALDNITPADIEVAAGTEGICLYFGLPETDNVPIWELYK